MQVGIIDLGRMGASIVRRLLAAGHQCVVFDTSARRVAELAAERAYGAASLADLANELDAPRTIWLAGPAEAVEPTIANLLPDLDAGDIIVDSGASHYLDDIRRAADLAAAHIHYLDVGIAGAIGRAGCHCCLTIGGDAQSVRYLDPVFRDLAAPADLGVADDAGVGTARQGYLHCGSAGAGHFVHMIHNGIECCLMAAYVEAFSVLRAAKTGRIDGVAPPQNGRVTSPPCYHYDFSLPDVAEVWRHGSLVGSSVLDLTASALAKNPALQQSPRRPRPARDEWAGIKAAAETSIAIPVLASAMYRTGATAEDSTFSDRLLAAVQQQCLDELDPATE
jgi:6-phosphogluconate dehydrogenase